MSATTKKKHVTKEVLEEYPLPDENRQVVKVCAGRGNNLHEVETAQGDRFLASMPSKFRKHVWIKRGDYILVEPIEEGDKVKAEISHILFKEQIKYIQEENLWPAEFSDKTPVAATGGIPDDLLPPSGSDSEDDLGDLCINVNRVQIAQEEEETDSEEDSDEDEEEDEENEREENDTTNVNVDSKSSSNDT